MRRTQREAIERLSRKVDLLYEKVQLLCGAVENMTELVVVKAEEDEDEKIRINNQRMEDAISSLLGFGGGEE